MSPAVEPHHDPSVHRLTLVPRLIWLWLSWRTRPPRFAHVSLARRLAWPPATVQTRRYGVSLSEAHGLSIVRTDV